MPQTQTRTVAARWSKRRLSLRTSRSPQTIDEKSEEILQILFGKGLFVVNRHEGHPGFLPRFQCRFVEGVDLLAGIEKLDGKAVFIEQSPLQLRAVDGDDVHGF